MRLAIAAAAVLCSTSLAWAQTGSAGPATSSGDAAVSPATVNPVTDSAGGRQGLGAGIASGAVNNGTTGDTIGAGHGTSTAPAPGQTTAPPTGDRRQ